MAPVTGLVSKPATQQARQLELAPGWPRAELQPAPLRSPISMRRPGSQMHATMHVHSTHVLTAARISCAKAKRMRGRPRATIAGAAADSSHTASSGRREKIETEREFVVSVWVLGSGDGPVVRLEPVTDWTAARALEWQQRAAAKEWLRRLEATAREVHDRISRSCAHRYLPRSLCAVSSEACVLFQAVPQRRAE